MAGGALSAQLEELVQRYGLADVLARPSLDPHARSLVALAACATIGTETELAACITDATANGVTEPELAEVFLDLGVVAGLPVARQAFAVAQRVLAEQGQAKERGSAPEGLEGAERNPSGPQNEEADLSETPETGYLKRPARPPRLRGPVMPHPEGLDQPSTCGCMGPLPRHALQALTPARPHRRRPLRGRPSASAPRLAHVLSLRCAPCAAVAILPGHPRQDHDLSGYRPQRSRCASCSA
jgi:alkylhydroperoxidase/carboxymuconolactone decarboxylase family protein YurZ